MIFLRKRGERISSKLILGFYFTAFGAPFLIGYSIKMTKEITEFQRKVYAIVKRVPKGKTTTYKAIAEKLNTSPRAVGQALKVNSYSFPDGGDVPCHRVIMSNGKIGGFSGSNPKNIKEKIKLLREEGVI